VFGPVSRNRRAHSVVVPLVNYRASDCNSWGCKILSTNGHTVQFEISAAIWIDLKTFCAFSYLRLVRPAGSVIQDFANLNIAFKALTLADIPIEHHVSHLTVKMSLFSACWAWPCCCCGLIRCMHAEALVCMENSQVLVVVSASTTMHKEHFTTTWSQGQSHARKMSSACLSG